jgi:hypothetical protein
VISKSLLSGVNDDTIKTITIDGKSLSDYQSSKNVNSDYYVKVDPFTGYALQISKSETVRNP